MSSACYVWKTLFPWSDRAPLAGAILLPLLPHGFLSLERRGVMKTSHLGLNMKSYLLMGECWRDGGQQMQNKSQGGETHWPFKLEGTGGSRKGFSCSGVVRDLCVKDHAWWGIMGKKKAWNQHATEHSSLQVQCFELWNKLPEKNIRLDLLNK